MQALRISVRGRVQGVGFRYFVLQQARHLGLCGYTRNSADGSVEVLAIGSSVALERMLVHLRQGPPAARVETVDSTAVDPEASYEGFEIKS